MEGEFSVDLDLGLVGRGWEKEGRRGFLCSVLGKNGGFCDNLKRSVM